MKLPRGANAQDEKFGRVLYDVLEGTEIRSYGWTVNEVAQRLNVSKGAVKYRFYAFARKCGIRKDDIPGDTVLAAVKSYVFDESGDITTSAESYITMSGKEEFPESKAVIEAADHLRLAGNSFHAIRLLEALSRTRRQELLTSPKLRKTEAAALFIRAHAILCQAYVDYVPGPLAERKVRRLYDESLCLFNEMHAEGPVTPELTEAMSLMNLWVADACYVAGEGEWYKDALSFLDQIDVRAVSPFVHFRSLRVRSLALAASHSSRVFKITEYLGYAKGATSKEADLLQWGWAHEGIAKSIFNNNFLDRTASKQGATEVGLYCLATANKVLEDLNGVPNMDVGFTSGVKETTILAAQAEVLDISGDALREKIVDLVGFAKRHNFGRKALQWQKSLKESS